MIFQLKQKLNLFCLRNALLSFSKLTAPDVWIKNPSSGDFQLNLLFKSHLLRFFASVSEFSWTPFSWQTQSWAWCTAWAVPRHTACLRCSWSPRASPEHPRAFSARLGQHPGTSSPQCSPSVQHVFLRYVKEDTQALLAAPASQYCLQCSPWKGREAPSTLLP